MGAKLQVLYNVFLCPWARAPNVLQFSPAPPSLARAS